MWDVSSNFDFLEVCSADIVPLHILHRLSFRWTNYAADTFPPYILSAFFQLSLLCLPVTPTMLNLATSVLALIALHPTA